jgi:hypothetical protein
MNRPLTVVVAGILWRPGRNAKLGSGGFYSRAKHSRIVRVPSIIIDAFEGRSSMMVEGEIEG